MDVFYLIVKDMDMFYLIVKNTDKYLFMEDTDLFYLILNNTDTSEERGSFFCKISLKVKNFQDSLRG